MAALFQEAQRVPKVPQATGNIFLSPHEEGVRLCVQRMSMESLVCCWLQLCFEPAPNFLQPGSGLGKHSRGSLWYCQAELCPTAFALAFIAQYFLVYFFICSPAWFTATSARMISMSSLAPSWRWQALDPSPFLISPSCAVSRSSASLADFQEVREGENGEVLLQFLTGSGKQGSSKGIALVCRYQWVPLGVGDR